MSLKRAAGVEAGCKKVGVTFFQIALMKARAKGGFTTSPAQASNLTRTLIGAFFIAEKWLFTE